MSIISRPTKTGGTTQYTTEVALGHVDILAAEVDADHNAIYTDYNGNITNANIAAGANIHGSKIADGTITADKLVTDVTVRARAAAPCITPNTVTGTSLVANPKVIWTASAAGFRGGPVHVSGAWALTIIVQLERHFFLRVRRNGGTLLELDYYLPVIAPEVPYAITLLPVPSYFDHACPAGTNTYDITGHWDAAAGSPVCVVGGPGMLEATEFA